MPASYLGSKLQCCDDETFLRNALDYDPAVWNILMRVTWATDSLSPCSSYWYSKSTLNMSLMERKYQENIIHFGILYLFCFSFLIQHGLGCSDIQMVTRTPGRGKRLIKPFCPLATSATTEACIFLWKYQKIRFVFENILLWLHGCGSQNSGIPTELPWLTFASSHRQICPLLRICFSPHTFQPFWAEFVRISRTLWQKFLFFQLDSHFLMAVQARMLHNDVSIPTPVHQHQGHKNHWQYIAMVANDTNRTGEFVIESTSTKLFPYKIISNSTIVCG